MHENNQKQKFMELRATGLSFDKISKEINVSKPTLISWSKELELEIRNLKALEKDALLKEFKLSLEHRVKNLGNLLVSIENEIARRNLEDIPTEKLFSIYFKCLDFGKKEEEETTLHQESENGLDMNLFRNVESWSA
jgi:hypothetical protein